MRICTITCQNADNYGARLQAYALAEYLTRQGHEVNVIDYRPPYMTFKTRLWYWPGNSIKEWAKLFLRMRQRCMDIKRHEIFDTFSKSYLPLTEIYHSIEELRLNPPLADVYIAGSDQIWNTTFANGTDSAYYLDFGDKATKRVSYAASFATKNIAQEKIDFVRNKLRNLDSISVRETSALSLLHSLGNLKGKVVLDPVFLLTAEDWNNLFPVESFAGDYILVYDFMRSKTVKKIAQRLSALTGSKIYSIGAYKLDYADKNFICASPVQFVGLIKQSRCVLSNSFHGTAFSLIYRRNFFVVDREDGLNERMADLLDRFELQERLITSSVTDKILLKSVDYNKVDNSIKKEFISSKEFLERITSLSRS